MTVLIDSWAWIEYINGSQVGKKVQEFMDGNDECIVSTINIAEVYKKLLADLPKEANVIIGKILQIAFVIPLNTEIALHAGRIKHEKKMGMADAIVLATARLHNAKIVTGDSDFKKENDVIYIGK